MTYDAVQSVIGQARSNCQILPSNFYLCLLLQYNSIDLAQSLKQSAQNIVSVIPRQSDNLSLAALQAWDTCDSAGAYKQALRWSEMLRCCTGRLHATLAGTAEKPLLIRLGQKCKRPGSKSSLRSGLNAFAVAEEEAEAPRPGIASILHSPLNAHSSALAAAGAYRVPQTTPAGFPGEWLNF